MKVIFLFIFLIFVIISGIIFFNQKKIIKIPDTGKKDNKVQLIFYSTKWCVICKKIKPMWEKSLQVIKIKYPNIIIKEIECNNSNDCFFIKNGNKIQIDGVPTIILRGVGDDKEYNRDTSNNILCNKTSNDISRFLDLYLKK